MTSPLREALEAEAGWEEFQMIIPHPFLPPRFQNLAKGRNMILLLDRDMTLHIRWEGARMHEHHPLTPGAVRRLMKEVFTRMTKYRRELQVFSKFVDENAEQPFDDPRAPDPLRWKEREMPVAAKEEPEEEDEAIEVTAHIEVGVSEQLEAERMLNRGGESPMGGDLLE